MFSNDYILINDSGIDLLRNRFAYQHIDYINIDNYKIEDGYLLRNRIVILLFGILLMIAAIVLFIHQLPTYYAVFTFNTHVQGSFRGLGLILLTSPAMIVCSAILIWQSLIKSKILVITSNYSDYEIRIKEIDKKGDLQKMIQYLDLKIKYQA